MSTQHTLGNFDDETIPSFSHDPATDSYKNPNWLRQEYISNHQSIKDIAESCDTSTGTIRNHLKMYGIEIRSVSNSKLPPGAYEKLSDEDWLRDQYKNKRNSFQDIADKFGVSRNTVGEWAQRHNIESRSMTESVVPDGAHEKLSDKAWLRKQYVNIGRSQVYIANELGVTNTTVSNWLDRHNIETRGSHSNPDHLDHTVDSDWELAVANLLVKMRVSYQREGMRIPWGTDNTHTYYPDFVTDSYIIEVKGDLELHSQNAVEKACAALQYTDTREYLVIGKEQIPADVFIEFTNDNYQDFVTEMLDVFNIDENELTYISDIGQSELAQWTC